jgi:hypothetical protein
MNKQVFNTTSVVNFRPAASFSERESTINKEILKANDILRQRGFYPLSHQIISKTDSKATISITYSA